MFDESLLSSKVTMFSVYCQSKFEVERVEVVYSDGKSSVYPDLSLYHMEVPLSYITVIVGVPLEENEVLHFSAIYCSLYLPTSLIYEL